MTVVLEAVQLLVSLVSTTVFGPSAQASRKYAVSGVAAGMVTVTVPEWLPPAARAGTPRLPVRSGSPALFTASSER